MWSFLDKIPYPILIAVAVFMLLAPIRPMPHVVEKLQMLKNGSLHRPIDILDLFTDYCAGIEGDPKHHDQTVAQAGNYTLSPVGDTGPDFAL